MVENELWPFPRTPEVGQEFEELERLKREARRRHTLSATECIEITSQLSELFPASGRSPVRYEIDEDPKKTRL